jgi:ABC-type phosphate transport system auxiliary subunit
MTLSTCLLSVPDVPVQCPGTAATQGFDFGAIPSQEEVFSTRVVNRVQRQQVKMASHGLKRQRVQELEAELMNTSLPDRKRLRTENSLQKAQERLQASSKQLKKASAATSKTKPPKQRTYGQVSREQWKKVALARAQAPPDGCIPSILSTTRCTEALERSHYH